MSVVSALRFVSWIAAIAMLATLIPVSVDATDDNASSEIVFLHLRVNGSGISLVDSRTVPGRLKTPRDSQPQGDLIYELVDQQSAVHFAAGMDDPLILKFDYEDPNEPGQLRSRVVQLNEAEFTVRVPVVPGATSVNFYRVDRTFDASARAASRQLIGTIPLDVEREVE